MLQKRLFLLTVQSYSHETNGMFALKKYSQKNAKFIFLVFAATNIHYLYIVI